MGRMNVSHVASRTSLELIFLQGETTGRQYNPPRVTVRVHLLSPPHPTICGLVVIHTDTD